VLTPIDTNGKPTLFAPKQEYKLFTRDEWLVHADLETDYLSLRDLGLQFNLKLELHKKEISKLQEKNEIYKEEVEKGDRALNQMSKLLDTEQEARKKESGRQRNAILILAGTTLVGIIAAAIFGGCYAAQKAKD